MARKRHISASGAIYTGKCIYYGFRAGLDATNDATITIYDNTAASGTEICPTNTYDASALGLNGEVLGDAAAIECDYGIYVDITCSGTCEVVVVYQPNL